jgi:hypothetical protein
MKRVSWDDEPQPKTVAVQGAPPNTRNAGAQDGSGVSENAKEFKEQPWLPGKSTSPAGKRTDLEEGKQLTTARREDGKPVTGIGEGVRGGEDGRGGGWTAGKEGEQPAKVKSSRKRPRVGEEAQPTAAQKARRDASPVTGIQRDPSQHIASLLQQEREERRASAERIEGLLDPVRGSLMVDLSEKLQSESEERQRLELQVHRLALVLQRVTDEVGLVKTRTLLGRYQ